MNQFETLTKCVALCKTVREAADYAGKNEGSGSFGSVLTNIRDAVGTVRANVSPVLSGEENTAFGKKSDQLQESCDALLRSGEGSADFFSSFREWDAASERIVFLKAVNLCNRCREAENGDAVALLQTIVSCCRNLQINTLAAYVLSRKFSREKPLEAYRLGMRAFELNRTLCRNIFPPNAPAYNYVYRKIEEISFDRCPVCHHTGTPYYCSAPMFMRSFNSMVSPLKLWMKCDSCGQLYTYRYPQNLNPPEEDGQKAGDGKLALPVMEPNSALIWIFGDILKKLISASRGKRLLEVGVGGGELIAAALELGCEAEGVEIIKKQAEYIQALLGVEIHCTDFLKFETSEKFDMITMGDVIEHIMDPVAAIAKANRLLKENGVLWISTPNFESGFSRVMKFKDPMWDEPYHISYFSYEGLKKILCGNGFRPIDYSISKRYNGSMEIIAVKEGAGR